MEKVTTVRTAATIVRRFCFAAAGDQHRRDIESTTTDMEEGGRSVTEAATGERGLAPA